MRIAITSASGNIGSTTRRRPRAHVEHQLSAIARRTPGIGPKGAEVEWVSADLTGRPAEPALRPQRGTAR
jgi:uncharacterized protein YbjT (DUF2867 family)